MPITKKRLFKIKKTKNQTMSKIKKALKNRKHKKRTFRRKKINIRNTTLKQLRIQKGGMGLKTFDDIGYGLLPNLETNEATRSGERLTVSG